MKRGLIVTVVAGFVICAVLFWVFVGKQAFNYVSDKVNSKKVAQVVESTDKTDQNIIQPQTQIQTQSPDQQTTGNSAGQTSTISSTTGIDIFTQGKDFIFDNGEEGYNFRIKENELLPQMVGDLGITVDGKRFIKTSILNRFRPAGNATVIKCLGKGIVDKNNKWPRVDTKVEGEYTYYQCPLSWKNGYCLFNFAYFTDKGKSTERYIAHEIAEKYPHSEDIM